jgi:preprotein translocase subunit SecY
MMLAPSTAGVTLSSFRKRLAGWEERAYISHIFRARMNETVHLHGHLRTFFASPRIQRRLRNPLSVLFLIAMVVIGSQLVTIPVRRDELAKLLAERPFLRLLDFIGGGAYQKGALFTLGALALILSRGAMTLRIAFLPGYGDRVQRTLDGHPGETAGLERRFVAFDRAAAAVFVALLVWHQATHGVIATDPRTLIVAFTFYFAGALMLLWIVLAIDISRQADGLTAIVAAGCLTSVIQWLLANARRSSVVIPAALIVVALAIAWVLDRRLTTYVPYRSPGMKLGRGLLRVDIGPMAPFAMDRILNTLAVVICAYGFDLMLSIAPRIPGSALQWTMIFGVPLMVSCLLYGTVAFWTRYEHLKGVARQLQQGGYFIEGVRPGNKTTDYLQKKALLPVSYELLFVVGGLLLIQAANVRAFAVPVHPLAFVSMWAVIELCTYMYFYWKYQWRDPTAELYRRKMRPI